MNNIYKAIIYIMVLTTLVRCNSEDDIYKLALSNNPKAISEYLNNHNHSDENKDLLASYCLDIQTIINSGYEAHSEIAKDIIKIKTEQYSDAFSHTLIRIENKEYIGANPDLVKQIQYLKWSGKSLQFDDTNLLISDILANEKKSYQDILQLFMATNILANIQYERNQLLQSLSTRHYFLYELENRKHKHEFTNLKDDCLKNILINISRENYDDEYSTVQNYYYNTFSTEYQRSFWGYLMKIYENEKSLTPEEHKTELHKALELARSPGELSSTYFNLAYYHSAQNEPIQHKFYQKAIESYGQSTCALHRFYPAIYGLTNTPSTKQKIYYEDVLTTCEICPKSTSDRIKFITFNYLEPSLLHLSPKDQIDTLLSVKHLAEELYPGKSTLHLQDYYSIILSRLFDVGKESQFQNQYSSIITNEVLDLRLKEKFRKSFIIAPSQKEINYERINEILLKINSFKSVIPYDNSLYKELFHFYLEEEKKKPIPYKKETVDVTNLKTKLKQENAVIINISQANNQYYCYKLSSTQFEINEFEKNGIDSLFTDWLSSIKSKNNEIKKEKKVTTRISELFSIDTSLNLIIIPDGQFSLVPIPNLFPNQSIQIYQNVLDYMNADSTIIVKNDEISIYSFSDSTTIHDRSIKTVPDLLYGFEECNSIANIIDPNMTIHSGYDFLEANLFNEPTVRLAHISSHASSSSTNHLDNFVISRNNNGNIEKLYSYEIPSKINVPEVVILSACETGTGKLNVGAGVQTLSRSLLDNGSKTVIKTLWKVNDKATTILMNDLYRYWISGESLDSSLNLAKQKLQEHELYSAPYYWAGFVLEGNPAVYYSGN